VGYRGSVCATGQWRRRRCARVRFLEQPGRGPGHEAVTRRALAHVGQELLCRVWGECEEPPHVRQCAEFRRRAGRDVEDEPGEKRASLLVPECLFPFAALREDQHVGQQACVVRNVGAGGVSTHVAVGLMTREVAHDCG
jgi:hypothetical protein